MNWMKGNGKNWTVELIGRYDIWISRDLLVTEVSTKTCELEWSHINSVRLWFFILFSSWNFYLLDIKKRVKVCDNRQVNHSSWLLYSVHSLVHVLYYYSDDKWEWMRITRAWAQVWFACHWSVTTSIISKLYWQSIENDFFYFVYFALKADPVLYD